MALKKELLAAIKKQRKESSKKKKFEGNFMDYVEMVQKNPDIVKTSHRRLYDAIMAKGLHPMPDSDSRKQKIFNGDSIKIYEYFEKEFFGMENVISKIMRFLKSASLKGEESRQVLLLMGPVGAGKSALVEHIKSTLEGEKYYYVEGDPQKGEPLQLLPRSLRNDFSDALGVTIDGDISPVLRYELLSKLDGEYENFKII